MPEATELTKDEQSLMKKLEEETKNTSGGLPSYVATLSENVGSAIELNNELSKKYGNTPISLQDLRKAGNFKNIMCSSSIWGSALGILPSAIEFNDALTSDIKNSRIDDTARVGLKVVVGIGVGALLLPYAAGAATVGMAAVGTAMVGYLSALAGNIIDESWETGKDYLKDLWSQLETRLNDFRNTLSPELQTVFDQCASPIFEGLQVCPTSLNALQTQLQNNYSDELNKAANNLGLNQCPLPQNKMDKIDELMDTAEKTTSPLIVDLDGDGIETSDIYGNVYFDHDNNGFAEKTGWVGKDDGLLVRDINGNGQIDNGTELFGNNSVLSNGQKAANGFEALKDLDSNKDSVFNSLDATWNEIKIWKDTNQNGFVENGELLSMEEANIKEINLNYQNENIKDTNENIIGQTGNFIKNDNSIGNISDIWFVTDASNTADRTNVIIPDDIKELPDLIGSGNVHNLHEAMALDESGTLKALVEQFSEETNIENRKAILLNIIYHWSGVQNMDPNGRDPTQVYGKVIDDTRKLEALEEFMGKEYLGTWCWGERDPNPHGKAAPYILRAFDILFNDIYNELLSQTHYKTLLENITMTWLSDDQCWQVDVSEVISKFQQLYAENHENGIASLREFEAIIKSINIPSITTIYEAFRSYGSLTGNDLDIMFAKFGYTYGTDLNDDLTGTAGVDEINGFAGADTIYGGTGNDILNGDDGNDNIFGEDGNDIITGGEGNDYLIGGNGADTYIFNPSFGNDAIDNSDDNASASEPDIIQFGEGILASNTTLGRQGYDLIITVSYDPDENGTTRPNDSIRVYSYFDQQGTSSATIDAITFADGTSWDYEYVINHWNSVPGVDGGETLEGNNENNTINGTNYNDILIGNGGNDTINAGNGNDRLLGGTGNDSLNGGSGDDTYLWNWGDGMDTISDTGNHDKISFGDGITYSDLKFRQEGGNLRITVKNNENQGLLLNSFFSGLNYKIEDLYFQDGSIIHLSEIPLTLHQLNTDETINLTGNGDTVYANGGNDTINGGQGNDFIYGGSGNDTVNAGHGNDIVTGGTGNDYLDGSWGSDTYIYNRGDGLDTISDSDGQNILKFGADISFDDLTFRNDNGSLRILINGNENQGIICKNFFTNDNYKINRIVFNDGTMYPVSATGLTLVQKESSETVTDTVYNDTIYGNNGDDTITCGDGNDVIYGGSGHDAINAGNGEDTIIGGKGDDALNGNAGANTYIYNVGDGLDTIWASNVDTLVFGEGISQNDLTFRQEGNNLRILINGSETDGIIDVNYYSGDAHRFKEIRFADGSVLDLRDIGFTMNQNNGSETVEGTSHADVINGNGGNDTIEARGGNDIVNGGLGDDIIRGHDGNDIITGGKGNDALDGGSGDDAYIYNLGDGYDTIYDASGVDTIKFGVGINFDNLTFHAEGNHLVINVGNNSDQGIFIYHMLNDQSYNIERLEFADGTIKNLSQMGFTFNQNETSEEINGTVYDDIINANGGNDTISAGNGNDILNGGSGNDTINADNGDDILIGGTGRDTLNGGSGDDSYIYNIGDGADHISDSSGYDNITFGEGISFEDLSFRMSGNDLKIIINNDETQYINISQYFYDNERKIEELNFSDGSQYYLNDIDFNITQTDIGETITTGDWDDTVIAGAGNDIIDTGEGYDTIDAGDGNDTINAGNGDDSLTGGRGNDILNGGNGNDTYYYNLGDGQDTINETGSVDKIVFGTDITREDLSFRQEGNNLIIKVKGDENQQITINNHFKYEGKNIEEFHFADGTVYNTQLEGFTLQLTDNAENITSSPNADAIYAAGGDDIIDSGNGNDFIDGGLGNDTITAGHGDDILSGSKGNDTLNGGSGHDTYKYNLGDGADVINETDGNDTLAFGSGISAADITYRQSGKDLILIIQNDESQQIKIVNFFNSDNYKVENFTFADGTTLQANKIGFTIKGEDYAETINGTSFADIINGNDGNDTIDAGTGNNIINGGNGNDTITTGVGDDVISGGKDNDILNGGSGSDTYKYNLGDGYDEITDAAGVSDRISFGSGISYNDLTFRAEGNHLRIIVKDDENQGILIKEALNNSSYAVDYLDFADGSSIQLSSAGLTFVQKEITETINATNFNDIINAEAGNDTINAKDGDDILNGGAGEDVLNAGNGNDVLNGGVGKDALNGEAGDDTYIWNLGDGKDVITDTAGFDKISFGTGISRNDLTFRAEGNNLFIYVKGDDTQGLVITNALNNNSYRIENITFADGSSLSLQNTGYTFDQTSLHETINATIYNDTINAEAGNDTINANNGDDIINAGAGNDTVEGGEGNDIITGGKGRDILNGGSGDDTYVYNRGDGFDEITENGGNDKIVFGEGIAKTDLILIQDGNNLKIQLNGNSEESITVKDHFNENNNYKIERLEFADGTFVDLGSEELQLIHQTDFSETLSGSEYNDTLYGFGGNDTLNAGAGDDILDGGIGNDTLNGDLGNDKLTGGKGDDTLNGGAGNDIYYYNLGDGVDTINEAVGTDKIVFGKGIASSDIKYHSVNEDLYLTIKNDSTQSIRLVNFFNANANYRVDALQFADGTVISISTTGLTYQQQDVSETINCLSWNDVINAGGGNDTINANGGDDIIYAGDGNDTVNAGEGNDTLVGGKGNDTLNGGVGSDIYHYNLGDGFDTIYDEGGTDRIVFGEGIAFTDLSFCNEGNNLRVFVKGNEQQGFCINEFFNGNNYKIERLQFADGSSKSLRNLGLTFNQSNDSETITGTNYNDVIYANSGDDTINASGGSDTIYAGNGNDIANAGAGNDNIYGGLGDDALNGGDGNDTYYYNLGDGLDTITETSGTDKIIFGEGISSSDLVYTRDGNNLHININGDSSQGVVIKDYFYSLNNKIENLQFADNSIINLSTQGIVLTQSDLSDTITTVSDNDDVVYGNGGADTISTGSGNDILVGGKGQDTLDGGAGNDTYCFNIGDGYDTITDSSGTDKIVFGEGIVSSSLVYNRHGNDLTIVVNDLDSIKVKNFFTSDSIESLEFFDGSSLSLNPETISISPLEDEDIVFTGTSASETITGGVGDDTLDGNGGNDTIYGGPGNDYININNATNTVHGGTGNDYINGSSGNDTYHYNRGDGFDTIVEYNGSNDKIIFGEGITRENLSFYADRNSLRILIDNDENQGILILNHFETDAKHMEYIEFADGTTIDLSQGIPFAQTNGNDILNGANGDDHYNGGSGNDYLKAYAGNDILSGDAGNDTVYGDDGDDILTGGTGNDYLEGGRGTDTYIYNLGDGFDVINNYDYYNSGNDKIQFGQGISLSDLTFKVDGSSLRININGDEKQGLLLQRHQDGGDYRMGKLEFADGSVFDLNTNGFTYHQTDQKDNLSGTGYDDIIYLNAGNDTAHGNNGNDTIYGGTGLDHLYGDGSNDILVGGTGDDYLEGGREEDTYIYNLGDGFDTINNYDYYNSGKDKILFGEGISLSDLTFSSDNKDLLIYINNDKSQGMRILRHFEGGDYRLGKIQFADGSILDFETTGVTLTQGDDNDVITTLNQNDTVLAGGGNDSISTNYGDDIINAGAGNDNVDAGYGNDDITGGKGNDILNGSYGADTYRYNLGDGFDIIYDYDSNSNNIDKIVFGEGITSDDLTFRNENNSLRIIVKGDETQGMLVNRFFDENYPSYYRIEQFEFADGTIIDNKSNGFVLNQLSTDETIRTTEYNDIIKANSGNDTIYSFNGNDIIDAGSGDDYVEAGYGNDDITGGKGNDILNGSYGADTYRYNLGDGFDIIYDYDSNSNNIDKIVFGEGITLADLTFRNENNNLRIIVKGDEGQGMLINQFFNENYPTYYQIEQFEFADGTIIDNKNNGFVLNQLSTDEAIRATEYNDIIKANSGNDTIYSFNGNDIIEAGAGDDYVEAGYGNDDITGGQGNDTLNGSYGADTYRYNLGDGFDIIYDYDGNTNNIDKIVFGEGISQDNLTFRLEGTSLRIIINNDETQGMLLDRFLDRNYESYYKIEQFVFADGSIMDNEAIGYKLEQLDFSEDVRTTEFADTVNANGGNDTVVTLGGNDIINGGAGNDYIDAGYGDDHIIGGTGNDKLIGYRGSDTYYYNIGDGFDTIEDYNDTGDNSVDKIVFGEGISKEDLTFSYEGGNLKIIIGEDTAQGIMINGFFSENYSSYYRIEKLEFADGSVIDFTLTGVNLIQNNGSKGIRGTEFADTIIADDTNHTIITLGGNDTIVSGSGHDRIEAGYGDDDITGGKGDDLLIGSLGSDTYRYNLGDGFDIIDDYDSSSSGAIDKIVFGEGITKDDLKFACRQNHLFITIKDDPTQGIRINYYFNDSNASYYKIEKLVFADGSEIDMNTTNLVLTQTDTAETVKATEFDDTIYAKGGNDTIYAKGGNDTIYSGDGNDRIEAGSGNDILVGGKGDDTLIGSTGSDTYLWNLGDGFDTIDDYEDPSVGNIDKIVFGEGITFNDLTFRNKDGGLEIYVKGDETQGLHINSIFNNSNESYYQIEQLHFSDGSVVELSQIGLTFDQTNGDEAIKTTAYDDVINAGAGNDNITALAGNDTIFGGDGNDTIDAGSGNDKITGGKGNDTLMGGTGNDTYYYNLGDGWDIIEDNDGTGENSDTISFGAGIALADLTFTQRDTNLEIVIKGDSSQGIVINRFFDPSYRKNFCIEKLAFADGTIIDVPSLGLVLNQTDGSETIYGSDNNDTINANGGNDTVYGYAGNDIINGGSGRDTIDAGAGNDNITGGKGDDIINGGAGNDTYYYNLGDGLDTITDDDSTAGNLDKIVFGAGIVQTDLSLNQRDNDLLITIKGDASQGILISRFFDPSYRANFCVEKLEFADGSSVDFRNTGITFNQTDSADTVSGTAFNDTVYAGGGNDTINTGSGNDIIRGGTGNDTINAGDGNDTITGGTGNDIIDGGLGNDTYVYNLGDGFDHINDAGGVDSIHFGEGITRSDLTLFDDNVSLRVTIKGDSEQGMLINKHFSDTNYKIESFQFADGSSINIGSADQLIQAMNSFSISNSASMDTLSNPTENVSDMYSLAASQDLTRKAS